MRTIRVACLLGMMAWVAPVSADDIIWDGGGADNNWDTAENWSNDVVPTFFENVFFTAASSKDCVVTQNQVVFDFTMTAGYAGTLSASGSPSLTVSGDMSVEGGTINWTSSRGITVEGNLAVSGGSVTMRQGGNFLVRGGSTITGGTVNWSRTDLRGDVLISAGTVTWSGRHDFKGDYIRTGGTVNTTGGTQFRLIAFVPQAFTIGAGGIALQALTVFARPLDVTGDITINTTGTTGFFDFVNNSTTNLNGTLTLNTGNIFTVSDSRATLNVLDGSVVDATAAGSYVNEGMINEIGAGVILRDATGVGFTDSAGVPVASVPAGTDLFITLFDEDENIDGTVFDTAEVTVTSLTTGDVETLTLTEIGTQSGEFSNTVGLPTAAGAAILGDGILQQDGSEDLLVSYTDDEDPGDTISGNLLAPPIVWDGGGADNNWDTPQNWTGDVVPGLFDDVRFDATSSKDCVVTQFQEMLNLTIAAGYTGTISHGSGRITFTLQVNGDLSVGGGNLVFAFRIIVVSGNTTITGGTVDWSGTRFTGDVLISGGTVTWGSSNHIFKGDYTRIGGTVNTATFTTFTFQGNAPQAFTIGAGGIVLRNLTVNGGSSQVLDITGDITGGFGIGRSSTTNLDGTLTLPGTQFTVGSLSTLNVLNGSVVDAVAALTYRNDGIINEIGTGVILRDATAGGLYRFGRRSRGVGSGGDRHLHHAVR